MRSSRSRTNANGHERGMIWSYIDHVLKLYGLEGNDMVFQGGQSNEK